MPKTKIDKDLFTSLRTRGVRKRVARLLAQAPGADGGLPKAARKALDDLKTAAGELEDALSGGPSKRSQAGRRAAATRRRNEAARSASAKKAARTRAARSK